LRTGQGNAGAISTTARFSSIENATEPGSVSGLPAIARSASPVTTFSIASAASPVESLISTEGCAARKAIENRRQMAIGGRDRAEDMQLAGERRTLLIDGMTKLLILQQRLLGKGRSSSPLR
jgi:hypothetical protein